MDFPLIEKQFKKVNVTKMNPKYQTESQLNEVNKNVLSVYQQKNPHVAVNCLNFIYNLLTGPGSDSGRN